MLTKGILRCARVAAGDGGLEHSHSPLSTGRRRRVRFNIAF